MTLGERALRAGIGIVVLVVLSFVVMNWVGDYRSATGEQKESSQETTGTSEATPTADAGSEGEGTRSPVPGTKVTVLVDGLNFRSGPSRDTALIRGLDANEVLELVAEEDGWLKVTDSQGKTGYVSASGSYTKIE